MSGTISIILLSSYIGEMAEPQYNESQSLGIAGNIGDSRIVAREISWFLLYLFRRQRLTHNTNTQGATRLQNVTQFSNTKIYLAEKNLPAKLKKLRLTAIEYTGRV